MFNIIYILYINIYVYSNILHLQIYSYFYIFIKKYKLKIPMKQDATTHSDCLHIEHHHHQEVAKRKGSSDIHQFFGQPQKEEKVT